MGGIGLMRLCSNLVEKFDLQVWLRFKNMAEVH